MVQLRETDTERLPGARIVALRTTLPASQTCIAKNEFVCAVATLGATAAALVLANSPWKSTYHRALRAPITLCGEDWSYSQNVSTWIEQLVWTIISLLLGGWVRSRLRGRGTRARDTRRVFLLVAVAGAAFTNLALRLIWDGTTARRLPTPVTGSVALAFAGVTLLGSAMPRELRALMLASVATQGLLAHSMLSVARLGRLDPIGLSVALFGATALLIISDARVRSTSVYVVLACWIGTGLHLAGLPAAISALIVGMTAPTAAWSLPRWPRFARGGTGGACSDAANRPTRTYARIGFYALPLSAFMSNGLDFGAYDWGIPLVRSLVGVCFVALVVQPFGIQLALTLGLASGAMRLPGGTDPTHLRILACAMSFGYTAIVAAIPRSSTGTSAIALDALLPSLLALSMMLLLCRSTVGPIRAAAPSPRDESRIPVIRSSPPTT